MHNAALAALKIDCRYVAFEVEPRALRAAIEGAKAMRFAGLNLTVPHKLLAMDMVDELDDSAKMWGAINTISFEVLPQGGEWTPALTTPLQKEAKVRSRGFNTDAEAVSKSLRDDLGLTLAGSTVVVLGAGGAGRVAVLKLAAEGVLNLFLVNRTVAKAKDLIREVHERFPQVKVQTGYPPPALPIDLLLNATSLGLKKEDALPFDTGQFSIERAQTVFDMIYRPAETPLLRVAKQAGCRVTNGLGMLLYQGAAAFEIWTGRVAPLPIMKAALREAVYGTQT